MFRMLFVAAVFSVFTLAPAALFACSCMRPGPPLIAKSQHDVVFVGKVVAIAPGARGTLSVDVNVAESLKGQLGDSVRVVTQSSSAACGYNFAVDTDYLVYADRREDGTYGVTLCSRTAPTDAVAEELALLRGTPPKEVGNQEPGAEPPPVVAVDPDDAEPETPEVTESGDTPVINPPPEQEEGREDIDVPTADSKPTAAISAHTMFRYTMNFGADDSAELYNLRIYLKKSWDDFVFYAEPRIRQTPLRSFSPSNIWVQQVWVGYDIIDGIRARAGLINTAFSRPWDNSWFGNLPYLNGLKLDPDYGIDIGGKQQVSDVFALDYTMQWLPASDGLNGFFAPADKFDDLSVRPGEDVVLDFDSTPGYTERMAFVARFVPRLTLGEFTTGVGGSFYTSELENFSEETGRKFAYGAEADVGYAGASLYGEWIATDISAGDQSIAWTHMGAGLAYTWDRDERWLSQAQGRVNVTQASYTRDQFGFETNAEEWFLALGGYLRLHEMVGFTTEYVLWDFNGGEVVNRIEWIIHAYF